MAYDKTMNQAAQPIPIGKQRARRMLDEMMDCPFVAVVFVEDEGFKVYCKGLSDEDKARVESLVEEIASA